MSFNKSHTVILILSFLLLSCTKEIPYKQDNFKPILVLNSIWEVDKPMKFDLSSSIGILDDTTQLMVENAEITIESDGKLFPVQEIGDGVYTSLAICEAGKEYNITLNANGFDQITARERAPKNIQAKLPDSTETIVSNEIINIDLKDPLSENFYMVELKALRYEYFFEPGKLKPDSILSIKDVPFGNLNKIFLSDLEIVSKETSFELFDDRLFNGREYNLQIEVKAADSRSNPIQGEVLEYYVSIKSISKAYFNFLKNYIVARPIYGGPFEAYREIPSNVINGAGIFGMYSQEADTVFIAE